jgi:hypothetical protein
MNRDREMAAAEELIGLNRVDLENHEILSSLDRIDMVLQD